MTHPYAQIKEVARLLGVTSFQVDPVPPEGVVRAATVYHLGSALYVHELVDERAVRIDCPSARSFREVTERFATWESLTEGRTLVIPDLNSLHTLLQGA